MNDSRRLRDPHLIFAAATNVDDIKPSLRGKFKDFTTQLQPEEEQRCDASQLAYTTYETV
jgi:hypothetical protein